jgi:hypothetical protein
MNHIQETLRFIESDEMRAYLFTVSDELTPRAAIVSSAPAPLERKIRALDLIAEQTPYDPVRGHAGRH